MKKIKILLSLISGLVIASLVVPIAISCSSTTPSNNSETIASIQSVSIQKEVTINENETLQLQANVKFENASQDQNLNNPDLTYEWFLINKFGKDTPIGENKNTLTIQPITQDFNNTQIYIKVINNQNKNNIVTSNKCQLFVNSNVVPPTEPTISIQGSDSVKEVTVKRDFQIQTINTNLPSNAKFDWQVSTDNGQKWTSLSKQPISSNDNQLWTFNLDYEGSYQLKVIVKDSTNNEITQSNNPISINAIKQQLKPVINTNNPINGFVGKELTIKTTNINKNDSVNWQYSKNGQWINFEVQPSQDSNNPNLWTITPNQAGNSQIKVIVNDLASDPININIQQPVVEIKVSIPENITIKENETLQINATIKPNNETSNLSFEWYKVINGQETKIQNQITDTLTINNATYNDWNNAEVYVKVNQVSSDKCLITIQKQENQEPARENIDYFVINGKTITSPLTTNSEIIQTYGNVPLPQTEDSNITQTDLVDMFSYWVV